MTLATKTQIAQILPCPKCSDPMGPYLLKGAEYPAYACGNSLCRYEGDGTLPRLLSAEEQRKDFQKTTAAKQNPEMLQHYKKTMHGSFWMPTSFWIARPEDMILVPYTVKYSERGRPERPKGWQVRLAWIADIDMDVLLRCVMQLNPNRSYAIDNATRGPAGWQKAFRAFLTVEIRDLFALVPDENLRGLKKVVANLVLKERQAWY